MRVQPLLFAGALAGLSLVAAPVLSQDSPRPPQPPRPSQPPSGMGQGSGQIQQALTPLLGTWEVTVKMFEGGSAGGTPTTHTGTSTRSWLFDGKVMKEDVRCGQMRVSQADPESPYPAGAVAALQTQPPTNPPSTPPGRPTPPPRPETPPSTPPATPPSRGLDSGGSFMGHGMFGFDTQSNKFEHIWCDNSSSNITLSTGTWDESAKTLTFMVQGAMGSSPTGRSPSATPPATPSPRPGSTPPATPPGNNPNDDDDDDDEASAQAQPRPGQNPPTTPPGQDRPGQTPPGQDRPGQDRPTPPSGARPGDVSKVDMTGLEKVVIRIQGDDRHTIEYYKSGNKFMEVAYSKSR